MKTFKIVLALVSLTCISSQPRAQNCNFYHKTPGCSKASEPGYIYNSQSRSGVFAKGTSSTAKLVIYSGFDYSISICADALLGSDIGFIIKDAKTGEVLYNNATDNKAMHTEFTCEQTRNTVIVITIPGKPAKGEPAGACLGILIEQKPNKKVEQ